MARLTFSMKQPLATAQGIDRPCCWPCTAPRLRSVWSRNTWRWCPWGKLRPQTLPVSNTRWCKTSSWQMRRIMININLASFALSLSRIQTEVSAREFSHCVILHLMDCNVTGDLLCSDGLSSLSPPSLLPPLLPSSTWTNNLLFISIHSVASREQSPPKAVLTYRTASTSRRFSSDSEEIFEDQIETNQNMHVDARNDFNS